MPSHDTPDSNSLPANDTPKRRRGGQPGNRNRQTHGQRAARAQPLETIADILADAMDKQAMLSTYIEQHASDADIATVAHLLAIHGQNASRLGRLLRDQRALSGDAADGLADALGKALDEVSSQIGIPL